MTVRRWEIHKAIWHENVLIRVDWGKKLRTALNVFLLASVFRVKL